MATRIVIIGGGPAGYEAALVAAARGREVAEVTVVDCDGIGGACVLWDCVPSKTFIASTGVRTELRRAPALGFDVAFEDAKIDLPSINQRVKTLATAQSADIADRLRSEGVELVTGRGELVDRMPGMAQHRVKVTTPDGSTSVLEADVVLIATGASPRVLPGAQTDGERILNWRQLYDLDALPEHLVVVGSGVTGAEFVYAYTELGVTITVVASRDQILPHEDSDAAAVLEESLSERGVMLVKNARADSVTRTDDGVLVSMTDGRTVEASHALMTVGSVPNTSGLGLERVGIELGQGDYLTVDRVSRTSAPGIYAAGDCTGLMLLASVAAMQGRIAMYHALGEGLSPIRLRTVAARCSPGRDRGRRRPTGQDRRRIGACPHDHASAEHQRARQDVQPAPRLREDLLPPRQRRRHRRRGGRPDRLRVHHADRHGCAGRPARRRAGRRPSRSTRR